MARDGDRLCIGDGDDWAEFWGGFGNFDDAFRGAIINFELNTEYRLFEHFALGAGFARIGVSAEVNDDDWRGKVTDAYRGYHLFGTFYF